MCTSNKAKLAAATVEIPPAVARINGRPVLQPTCNRVTNPSLERRNSLKKISPPKTPSPSPTPPPPSSPPPPPPSLEKITVNVTPSRTLERKKSKSFKESSHSCIEASLSYSSSLIVEAPGSIAAVRREQMAFQTAQRKMKIAHYGRSKSAKFDSVKVEPVEDHHKRTCSFITPNSDPIYVAYHDQEWGVPVHDDNLLFELLVLSGAQVGSDWTSILKKRQDLRNAFSGFDPETVSKLSEKQMISISTDYAIDISKVRGIVDNSNKIFQIQKEFGSFDKYVWAFVNYKAISTQYKFGHKMPVKTSKSETISKDMVRRGFRFVGPTIVHSFMQAAGLTNDHLITCHRHLSCSLMSGKHQCITRNENAYKDD